VQAIGGGVVGMDGDVGIFETATCDFIDTEKEDKGNFKFEISDFK
jgi:hypothetical protein